MLLKYSDSSGAENAPVILKKIFNSEHPQGRDASFEGAFCVNDTLEIIIRVPRRLGARGVVLRIAGDGEDDHDFALSFKNTDCIFDEYAERFELSELCRGEDSGLFYYEFLFLRGYDTLFSESVNNVDFRLCNHSSDRFRLLIYDGDYKTPNWFGEGIVYHIFVDRFANGTGNVSIRDGILLDDDWFHGVPQYGENPGDDVENNVFFGGNLWGVVEKLDYLVSLGVRTIYLSPVFEAASNHKYDTGDYTKIDGLFGGDAAFDKLLEETKKRGIRVVLDGVFNHTGSDSKYFNRYGRYEELGAYQSPDSPYFNWYNFKEYPDRYECWWNIEIMPRLNHANENCRRYFTGENGICASYVRRGISGWRLDVADELSDEFLDELRRSVKAASGGEAVIVGEVWENAADKIAYSKRRRYLRGKQLDSVMNYPIRNGIIEFVLCGDSEMLYNILTEIYSSYPRQVCDDLMNLLGTHDTERILTVLADADTDSMKNRQLAEFRLSTERKNTARRRLMIASTIQYTIYGVPSLYYGDEAGVEGGRDPFCRMPFPWGREDEELLAHYRRLGEIRRDESVYRAGEFRILDRKDGFIAFERSDSFGRIVTLANSGNKKATFLTSEIHKNLLNGDIFEGNVIIEPQTAMILKQMTRDNNA